MVFVLMFGNHVFQVFIPSPENLQNRDFTATYAPFLFGPDDANPVTPEIIDLGGTQRVKNEMVPIIFGFESVTSQHTTRHENIATTAYFIWQAGGSRHDNNLCDWLLAEQEIMANWGVRINGTKSSAKLEIRCAHVFMGEVEILETQLYSSNYERTACFHLPDWAKQTLQKKHYWWLADSAIQQSDFRVWFELEVFVFWFVHKGNSNAK